MGFPLPLPVRCQEAGKRKWKCALLRPASHGGEWPSSTRRAADAVTCRPCLTAVRSHASGNPGRDEGMDCFDRTKGWKHAGPLTFLGFFRSINYRGSAVGHPQILCQFSLPIILSARNSGGLSVISLVSAGINIFLCTFDDENV